MQFNAHRVATTLTIRLEIYRFVPEYVLQLLLIKALRVVRGVFAGVVETERERRVGRVDGVGLVQGGMMMLLQILHLLYRYYSFYKFNIQIKK